MKSIILARVSTQEQMDGQSIPAQLERSREYRKRKGLEPWKEFQFDESSIKDHRKKFEEIIELIKTSKERVALIVETIDRMQRSFKESVLLLDIIKADKVEVHFIRENLIIDKDSNSSELLRWDMGVMFARGFVLQISDNVKRTFRQKLANGEAIGQPKLGYISAIKDGKKFHIPDPEKAHFIPAIFELYLQGWSFRAIADEMYKRGLRSRNNKKVSQSNIQKVIKDPFYCGIIISKGKEYPHHYEKLISFEKYSKAQNLMTRKSNLSTKTRHKVFALSRLVHCKNCHGLISAEPKRGHLVYYSCSNYKNMCKRLYIREEVMLKPVLKALKSIQLPQERMDMLVNSLKRTHEAKRAYQEEATSELRQRYDKIQAMNDRLIDMLADGRITDDVYDKKLKQYKEDQRSIELQLQEYTDADEQYHITAKTILSLAQRALEIFNRSEVTEKQQFLGYFLQNAQLNGSNLEFTLRNPFNLLAEYASRPNWLPEHDIIITILSDQEYMTNLWNKLCYIKEVARVGD